jgi:tetratricopeptide (TPR) repeat protein
MVGNIFLKFKKDVDTAIIYYNEVLRINPNDYLTLNNIGATLLQLGNVKESKEYFKKAIVENPDYPNTYIGLAFVYHNENNLNEAFDFALKALNLTSKNDEIYKNSFGLIGDIVNKLSQSSETLDIVNAYLGSLESKYDTNIKIEEDASILTSAKIEIKENYKRDYHLVKYKTNNPAYPHLVMHELLHLELIEDAKAIGENSLFISNNSHNSKFKYLHSEFVKTLKKRNIAEESINNYLDALFNGLNLQVFNTPIDLFIEDIINTRFKTLKPIQFYSLFTLLNEGIEATTRKDIVDNSPKDVLSISKIYNLVNALHFKNLFGIDLINSFQASKVEIDTATKFYNEFLEYKDDKKPAEEYELIQHWSEDLNIDGYFDLINEIKYRNQSIDSVIEELKSDPFDLETPDSSKERKMKQFIENHSNNDVNFAVAMYMTDAIPFISKLSNDEQKKIAFEFATLGMTGIDPNKDGYSIQSIPNKKFTGYQTLAFYYVSWAVGIPDMLNQLQMPFDKEYEIAKQFNNI